MLPSLLRRLMPETRSDEPPVMTTTLWLVVCAVTGAKLLFVLWSPIRQISMSAWLLDDSYITMRVARNIGQGLGFSFDGVHPTTGVSPLWTYATACFHIFLGRDAAATLTLLASTLFGGIAAILTFDIARTWTRDRAVSWMALILALLMPTQFFNALNGMETALFTSLLLGAFALLLRIETSHRPALHGAIAGILLGLAFMTRADAVFAIATVFLFGAITWMRTPDSRTRITWWIGSAALTVACFAAAFLAWQWMQSGSWHPDNQVGRRSIALAKHGFDFDHFSLTRYATIVAWNIFQLEDLFALSVGSSLLALLGIASLLSEQRTARFAWIVTCYTLLFAAALVGYQWYFPDFHGLRYMNPASHVALIAVAWIFARSVASASARRWMTPVFVACLLILSWYRYYDLARSPAWAKDMGLFGQPSTEKQASFWGTFDCINANLPADAVIAARDHGRLSYFTDRRMQDIAGILDPGILAAQQSDTLGTYLHDRGVDYVFLPDHQEGANTIFEDVRRSVRLTPVAACPPRTISEYRLYAVSWSTGDFAR